MKFIFALTALILTFASPALAKPIALTVNFTVMICEAQAGGSALCRWITTGSENIELDNSPDAPGVWERRQSVDGHSFEGSVGLVRDSGGDRLIVRSVIFVNGQERIPAQVAVKLSSVQAMHDLHFEPEPYKDGKLTYEPRITIWPTRP